MEIVTKKYNELTLDELYEILRIRNAVFVVEQTCPYQDIDGNDKNAYHVFAKDEQGIHACLRVMKIDSATNQVIIGRVLTVKRKSGLGSQIMAEGIRVARDCLLAEVIKIGAQVQAKGFYEKQGFVQSSVEYMLDHIPHIDMTFNK